MKIVAIVPIKLNNERLPNKNIKLLYDGKPLISRILKTLSCVEKIDERYVFCSDEKIIPYLNDGVKFLKRDKELDSNVTNFTQIFESFIDLVDADIYVYTHATAPLISKETIETCINKILYDGYDSAFTATKVQTFYWKNNSPNYDTSNIPRTQDLEPIYIETSGLYAFKKDVFVNTHSRIGKNPYICEVLEKEAIDVDNIEDFELANAFIRLESEEYNEKQHTNS